MPRSRKTRIVVFRVSEPEYDGLRAACRQEGAACVSEYIRTAVMELSARGVLRMIAGEMRDLKSRLAGLDERLSALVEELERKAGKQPHSEESGL